MKMIKSVNEFVVRFANVNGTGSASANGLFAKAMFKLGLPVSPKNIFPSNIQGMPTFYEVRVSEKGYMGRRGDLADIVVAMNGQSIVGDIQNVMPGGYLVYDNTRKLDPALHRDDITMIGIPITEICLREYQDPKQRMLFKNVIYIGALAALIDLEFQILVDLISKQFKGKEKLIAPNIHALEMGYQNVKSLVECPIGIRVRAAKNPNTEAILVDGNAAAALGAVYGGATVCGWYPITPSTSVIENFGTYCDRLRIDPVDGTKNFAIMQAEDELSAIGIAIGGAWNGCRSFTSTSGPGISLMSEFLGLAYFAEIPIVLINIQRAGPSTGMPTRTQQSDVLSCAYASHGDTKQVLLFPSSPAECFEMGADAFDFAERLQTPVIMMSDLNLGMNDHYSRPFTWSKKRPYDRGKVLNAEQLESIEKFGRYLDVDGDGICYRTIPGEHPTKGAYFTRGTSRDAFAIYTEKGEEYVKNMDRLTRKFKTAENIISRPEITKSKTQARHAIVYYGTTDEAMSETVDLLAKAGVVVDLLRIRAFPFHSDIEQFIGDYEQVFVVDQNRDAQMKTLLVNELAIAPNDLHPICNYDGLPITAEFIAQKVMALQADSAPGSKKSKASMGEMA